MNLKTIGLIVLLVFLIFIAAKVLADVKAERIKLKVSEKCIEKVEEVAGDIEGVIQTHWDKDTGELEIVFEHDKTNLQEIEKTISEAGFDTPNFKAPEEVEEKNSRDCKEMKSIGN